MKLPSFIFTFCALLLTIFSLVSSFHFPNFINPRKIGSLLSHKAANVKENIGSLVKGHFGGNYDPSASLLSSIYPETAEDVKKRLNRIESCFVPVIKGGTRVKLFEEPLDVLVTNILKAYFPEAENQEKNEQWRSDMRKKIKNLVANIKGVAHHVIECLKGLDDPNFEPTKLALNRFSLMVNLIFCLLLKGFFNLTNFSFI